MFRKMKKEGTFFCNMENVKMVNDLLQPVLKLILKKCYKSLFKRNATNYLSQKIIFQYFM